ncbi:hypothetical protein DICVIV_14019 [Dictyocaulus viviparus]|uniref:DNA polymerase delta subunit 3 n=1 Tax=Dictyocaulus viviparus TaxID=29172 RepID=A0A0D8XC59_DICVI|nr:hypothetical protein DICVIV_14019 [Dictyocaulus viviparus]
MKEFYDKHKGASGLWAAFVVRGSVNKFGVRSNATVLYRDTDLEEIKDAFDEVFAVELFSLQVIEATDLRMLLVVAQSQEHKSFGKVNRGPVYSRELAQMAEDLRCKVQKADSDVLLAMRNFLGENEAVQLNEKQVKKEEINTDGNKAITVKKNTVSKKRKSGDSNVLASNDSNFNTNCVKKEGIRFHDKSQTTCVSNNCPPLSFGTSKPCATNESFLNLSNNDIFDDEVDDHNGSGEPSQLHHESPIEKSDENVATEAISKSKPKEKLDSLVPECSGAEDVASNTEQVISVKKEVKNFEEVPVKKKKTERLVETYKDEDGFLVTKEVVKVVESDESSNTYRSKPLCSSQLNKVNVKIKLQTKFENSQVFFGR